MDSAPNLSHERTSEKKGWKLRQKQSIKTHYKRHGLLGDDTESLPDHLLQGLATSPRSPGVSRIAGNANTLRYSSSTPDDDIDSPEQSPSFKNPKFTPGSLSPRHPQDDFPSSYRNKNTDRTSKIPKSPLNTTKEHKSYRFKVVEATEKEALVNETLKQQIYLLSDKLAAQKLQSQQSATKTAELEEEIFRLNSLRLREEHQNRNLEARLKESDHQVEMLTASNIELRDALLNSQIELVKIWMAATGDTAVPKNMTRAEQPIER